MSGTFACSEMITRSDDKIDAPNSGSGRRPWPTMMPGASGRYPTSG